MKLKLFHLIFFFTFSIFLSAQVKEKYSKTELITFLKIYKHSLDHPFDIAVSMKMNASKIKISEERLGEILQAQFAGKSIKLTDAENKEMLSLKKLMEVDEEKHKSDFKKYIVDNKIAYEKYVEMETLFHSSQKFQNKINKLNNK